MNIPGVTAYTAAKAAMGSKSGSMDVRHISNLRTIGLVDSLAIELESFNIRVTCIEPGDFRTVVFKV